MEMGSILTNSANIGINIIEVSWLLVTSFIQAFSKMGLSAGTEGD